MVFTLAYGSMIRNIVDVERTVLVFIIGKTPYTTNSPIHPFSFFSRRTKVFSIHRFYQFRENPITFPSQRPKSHPRPNEADDLLSMFKTPKGGRTHKPNGRARRCRSACCGQPKRGSSARIATSAANCPTRYIPPAPKPWVRARL